jgi:RNA polymerase sigma factor (sigma-70 family)
MSVRNLDDFSPTEQSGDSMIECFGRLKEGEAEAAQQLWNRYSSRLVRVAKERLGSSPCGIGDEEDVAQSVFRSIFRGAAEGRFDQISTRDELWWLLLSSTKRKAVDHIRREAAQKRGGQLSQQRSQSTNGQGAARQFSLDELIGSSPTPDFLVELDEQYGRLLDILRNDQLRRIAILRIDGYTVAEIAQKVGVGHRAVERKLQLIRGKWKRELLDPGRR